MSFGLIQKDVAFTNAGIQRSINNSTSTEVLSIAELTATNITATNIAVGVDVTISNLSINVGTTQILPMDVNVDSILCRQGIKVGEVPQIIGSVNVSDGYFINGNPVSQNNTFQVDNLPSPEERSRAFVNDSSVQAFGNFGLVVQGGGTDFVPVYANGIEWLIG